MSAVEGICSVLMPADMLGGFMGSETTGASPALERGELSMTNSNGLGLLAALGHPEVCKPHSSDEEACATLQDVRLQRCIHLMQGEQLELIMLYASLYPAMTQSLICAICGSMK